MKKGKIPFVIPEEITPCGDNETEALRIIAEAVLKSMPEATTSKMKEVIRGEFFTWRGNTEIDISVNFVGGSRFSPLELSSVSIIFPFGCNSQSEVNAKIAAHNAQKSSAAA